MGSSVKSHVLYMWSNGVFKNLSSYHYLLPLDLALAAITKYHRWGTLNNKHLFLPVLEAGKSNIMVTADTVPHESLLLDCRWNPSCCVLTWRRKKALVSLLFL